MQNKKIIKIFNIKISISNKDYFSKITSILLKKFNFFFPNKKKYKYIIPIGENCLFSINFNRFHKFVDSTLLNWADVFDYEKIPEILKKPELIYSEGFSYIKERNMYLCKKYNISFHARSYPSELLNPDGEIDELKKEKEFEELKSRTKYLTQKTQNYINSKDKKLFVFLSDKIKNHSDIQTLDTVFGSLASISENFDILFICISDTENENINLLQLKYKNLFVRQIKPEKEKLDWVKILCEFSPETKLKQNRKRKYEYMD